MAAHARDVNIFIWTSRRSVGHGTNDRVMVHGEGTRADGRRSEPGAKMNEIVGSGDGRAARYASSIQLSSYKRGGPEQNNLAPWYMGLLRALAQPSTPSTRYIYISYTYRPAGRARAETY